MPVAEFHEVFEIGNADIPNLLNSEQFELRHRLMLEENEEYLEACRNENCRRLRRSALYFIWHNFKTWFTT